MPFCDCPMAQEMRQAPPVPDVEAVGSVVHAKITMAYQGIAWAVSGACDWPVVVWVRGEWGGNVEDGPEARMACTVITDAKDESHIVPSLGNLYPLSTAEDWKAFLEAKRQAVRKHHIEELQRITEEMGKEE